jgi:hypothetical protein
MLTKPFDGHEELANRHGATKTPIAMLPMRHNGPLHLHAKRSGAKRNEAERIRCKRVLGGLWF